MSLASIVGSAAPWRVRELRRLDHALRASHPLAVRVGVVGVGRGIGTSVAAGLVASVLAAHGHRVLAVNSSRPGRSLLWHAGLAPTAPPTPGDDERRAAASLFAEVVDGLPQAASGVYGVELADSPEGRWGQAVAPIARFFDYTVTDWGARTGGDLAAVTAASTVTAVVSPADRSAVQRAVDLAAVAEGLGTVPLIVVTDPQKAWNPAWQELCDLLPFPAVHLAHDSAHGEDRPRSSRRLTLATRLSGLRLAAATAQAATVVGHAAPVGSSAREGVAS